MITNYSQNLQTQTTTSRNKYHLMEDQLEKFLNSVFEANCHSYTTFQGKSPNFFGLLQITRNMVTCKFCKTFDAHSSVPRRGFLRRVTNFQCLFKHHQNNLGNISQSILTFPLILKKFQTIIIIIRVLKAAGKYP